MSDDATSQTEVYRTFVRRPSHTECDWLFDDLEVAKSVVVEFVEGKFDVTTVGWGYSAMTGHHIYAIEEDGLDAGVHVKEVHNSPDDALQGFRNHYEEDND